MPPGTTRHPSGTRFASKWHTHVAKIRGRTHKKKDQIDAAGCKIWPRDVAYEQRVARQDGPRVVAAELAHVLVEGAGGDEAVERALVETVGQHDEHGAAVRGPLGYRAFEFGVRKAAGREQGDDVDVPVVLRETRFVVHGLLRSVMRLRCRESQHLRVGV